LGEIETLSIVKAKITSPRTTGEHWIAQQFDMHAQAVFRLAFAQLRDAQDAQDVVQDTFVIAWRKRDSIELIDGSALPWLLTTARFTCLARLRGEVRRRTKTVPPEWLREIPSPSTDDEAAVDELLATLGPADRQVIELVLVEGLSYVETAERLGLSVSATGKRLQRARDRLRTQLRPDSTRKYPIERTQV
jgi:RNA polymerase sigma factor (sigma-70 family)